MTPRARMRRRLGRETSLAGSRVLVTGASSGIGEATARRLGSLGATVVLVARRDERLHTIADEIVAAGGTAYPVHCDLTHPDEIDALVTWVRAELGGVDYLVNNAGRSIRRSLELSYDRVHDLERQMALNFFGAVRLTLGLLPGMREQRFGHVVNVVSWGVQAKLPKFAGYLASKSALDTWSRIAGRETYADNVTFTNMRMGLVLTPMVLGAVNVEGRRALTPDQAADRIVRAMRERPLTVDTWAGSTGELLALAAPRFSDLLMNRKHRSEPDLAAAVRSASVGRPGTPLTKPRSG